MWQVSLRSFCARDCWLIPYRWSVGGILLVAAISLLAAPSAIAQDSFFDGYVEVESLDGVYGLDGTNGFIMDGVDSFDDFGRAVSGAGDINGDGTDDFVIGAPFADPNGADDGGQVYVVFGSASGFGPSLDVNALEGTDGFVIQGAADESLGFAVSGAGDVNDDGIDDLIMTGGFSHSYILFGSQTPFPAVMATSSFDGTNGFALEGSGLAFSVDGAGDINGDGVDDIVIGGHGGFRMPNRGYVVFGSSSGFPSSLQLDELDGTNGFALSPNNSEFGTRGSVSGAGDVNGDGIDDIIVGDYSVAPSGGYLDGESYVVFGSTSEFPATVELSDLDGEDGFILQGEYNSISGWSVSGAGDVNGDGVDDIVIGAPDYFFEGGFPYTGQAYVVFGSKNGFPTPLDLGSLNGENGFKVRGDCDVFPGECGSRDRAGDSVRAAGDVNGDGFSDLIIGAPEAHDNTVEAYVIFGSADGFPAVIDVGSPAWSVFLLDGTNGFAIEDYPAYGEQSVSGAGDVNGDGIADIIVGQVDSSLHPGGRVYVIFGARRELVPEPSGLLFATLGTLALLASRSQRGARLNLGAKNLALTEQSRERGVATALHFSLRRL